MDTMNRVFVALAREFRKPVPTIGLYRRHAVAARAMRRGTTGQRGFTPFGLREQAQLLIALATAESPAQAPMALALWPSARGIVRGADVIGYTPSRGRPAAPEPLPRVLRWIADDPACLLTTVERLLAAHAGPDMAWRLRNTFKLEFSLDSYEADLQVDDPASGEFFSILYRADGPVDPAVTDDDTTGGGVLRPVIVLPQVFRAIAEAAAGAEDEAVGGGRGLLSA